MVQGVRLHPADGGEPSGSACRLAEGTVRRAVAWMLVLVAALSGCTSVTPPAPTAPAAPTTAPAPAAPAPAAPRATAEQRAALPAALGTERQWLQSWFKGTPVVINQRSDGAVNLEVPREFSFDSGRSNVKPALGAVLDKVAESLRRVPLARLSLVAAPDDAKGTPALALERAAQVHKHLLSRGVPETRLGKPTATAAAAVQLRIEAMPP